ncbi:MltA domain-containing protein [Piscirickettsia litoralis]|uniref:MltA domain-containing protein n=1 Tax=Piscirickettsia litoralis TaxID=1891921 RepID=UPI000982467A
MQLTSIHIQSFLIKHFKAYFINTPKEQRLFTGYYLYQAPASAHKKNPYTQPVYSLPQDLLKIKLTDFQKNLTGENTLWSPTNQPRGD